MLANLNAKSDILLDLGNMTNAHLREDQKHLANMALDFSNADALMNSTIRKLKHMVATGGSKHICYLAFFVLFVLFVLYFIMKSR